MSEHPTRPGKIPPVPVLAAVGEKHQSNPVVSAAYELAPALDEELRFSHVVPEDEFESHRATIFDAIESDEYSFRQEEQSAAQFSETASETLGEYEKERVRGVGCGGEPKSAISPPQIEYDASYVAIDQYKRSPTSNAIFRE